MRARESVSARLDGELSELEAAGLEGHLRACAGCSVFARELGALTAMVGAAPLEQLKITVSAPVRRRAFLRLQTAAAAAAVVALAAGSSFAVGRAVGGHGARPQSSAASTSSTSDALSLRTDVVNQHMLAMLRRLEPGGELRVGRIIVL